MTDVLLGDLSKQSTHSQKDPGDSCLPMLEHIPKQEGEKIILWLSKWPNLDQKVDVTERFQLNIRELSHKNMH